MGNERGKDIALRIANHLLRPLKWTVEKDIRLFILDRLQVAAAEFKGAYERLCDEATAKGKPIEMDYARAHGSSPPSATGSLRQ